jgi:tetratricopeptide (TPR) repeat protein
MHVVSPHRALRQLRRGLPETPWSAPAPPPGTGYLVNGSVRRAGNRIRVTVQLEDAQSGIGLWADRFDRPLDDLFAVQEELAERLASQVVSHVEREGTRRARRRPPASLDAYDLCLRGRELYHRATEADTTAARDLFARAVALDPEYAAAYAWQAYTVQRGFTHLWGEPRGRPAAVQALELARRAVEIEPDSPLCLSRLAFILLLNERWDEALETGRAAVSANPSSGETRLCRSTRSIPRHGGPCSADRCCWRVGRKKPWWSCNFAPHGRRITRPACKCWWSLRPSWAA